MLSIFFSFSFYRDFWSGGGGSAAATDSTRRLLRRSVHRSGATTHRRTVTIEVLPAAWRSFSCLREDAATASAIGRSRTSVRNETYAKSTYYAHAPVAEFDYVYSV